MNSGCFKKGFTPWNKGKKGVNGKSKTRFKKGNVTWNKRQIGDERIDLDGYVYIKVAEPNKWKLKHRVIYEQNHGEITSNTLIRFFDNNPLNMNIDNLYAVTKQENGILNRINFANEPTELKPAILALVKLSVKAKVPYRVKSMVC